MDSASPLLPGPHPRRWDTCHRAGRGPQATLRRRGAGQARRGAAPPASGSGARARGLGRQRHRPGGVPTGSGAGRARRAGHQGPGAEEGAAPTCSGRRRLAGRDLRRQRRRRRWQSRWGGRFLQEGVGSARPPPPAAARPVPDLLRGPRRGASGRRWSPEVPACTSPPSSRSPGPSQSPGAAAAGRRSNRLLPKPRWTRLPGAPHPTKGRTESGILRLLVIYS